MKKTRSRTKLINNTVQDKRKVITNIVKIRAFNLPTFNCLSFIFTKWTIIWSKFIDHFNIFGYMGVHFLLSIASRNYKDIMNTHNVILSIQK